MISPFHIFHDSVLAWWPCFIWEERKSTTSAANTLQLLHCKLYIISCHEPIRRRKVIFFVSGQNLNISTRSLFFAICFASFQWLCIAISVLFFAEKYHGDRPVTPFQRCKSRVQTKQEKNNSGLDTVKNIKKKKLQLWLHSISPNLNHCKVPVWL